jgi:two-component system phosphate regulon sensor histidine kinase PhoR
MLYFNHSEKGLYLNQLEENLIHEARLIKNSGIIDYQSNSFAELDKWVKEIGEKIDTRITIINKYGKVIADSDYIPADMDNHLNRPEIQEVLNNQEKGLSIRRSDTLDIDMFYLAIPVEKDAQLIGFIRLSKSLQDINEVIRNNVRNNLIFFFFMLIITFLLVWKFTRDIIYPLGQITRYAGNLAEGNFQERVELGRYSNEIGTLAQMFNFMASQLESKIKQISDEKNRAEAILSNMVDGLIAVDTNYRIRLINPAARKMFQLNEEVKGKRVIEVLRHHVFEELIQETLQENEIINEELVLQKEEKKVLRCNFVPILNETGQANGAIVVFNDITELRRLEQLRKDFVGNVSHELRTPLTSIIGYIDTIIENDIEDVSTIKRFLNIIKTEADRLALLIKDLLDLSKLENKNQYVLRPGDLNKIINKVIQIFEEKARKRKINLFKNVEVNLLVYMISEQIEQVLINLVDNALKYTPEGGQVLIRAYKDKDFVVIEVEDSGIGISKQDQERIFERFYRVDKARSRALGGTGIGLSIVKHIIQNHHSSIEVESELDKGTVFRFRLELVK